MSLPRIRTRKETMFRPLSIIRHIRKLWQATHGPNRHQPRGSRSQTSDWLQNVLSTPCRPEVITWNQYLVEDSRDALLDIYAGDRTDDKLRVASDFLRSRSLEERVRVEHFDWTFTSYTVPDWPTYCVWLTRDEIRTSVFPSPVPPFMAIAYDCFKRSARQLGVEHKVLSNLLFEEERTLQVSQLLWRPEHFAIVQFYRTLPYNMRERRRRGRWVQEEY